MMETLYTAEDVAQRYKVTAYSVMRWIRDGKLVAKKVGRKVFVSEKELSRFENANSVYGK